MLDISNSNIEFSKLKPLALLLDFSLSVKAARRLINAELGLVNLWHR